MTFSTGHVHLFHTKVIVINFFRLTGIFVYIDLIFQFRRIFLVFQICALFSIFYLIHLAEEQKVFSS